MRLYCTGSVCTSAMLSHVQTSSQRANRQNIVRLRYRVVRFAGPRVQPAVASATVESDKNDLLSGKEDVATRGSSHAHHNIYHILTPSVNGVRTKLSPYVHVRAPGRRMCDRGRQWRMISTRSNRRCRVYANMPRLRKAWMPNPRCHQRPIRRTLPTMMVLIFRNTYAGSWDGDIASPKIRTYVVWGNTDDT